MTKTAMQLLRKCIVDGEASVELPQKHVHRLITFYETVAVVRSTLSSDSAAFELLSDAIRELHEK